MSALRYVELGTYFGETPTGNPLLMSFRPSPEIGHGRNLCHFELLKGYNPSPRINRFLGPFPEAPIDPEDQTIRLRAVGGRISRSIQTPTRDAFRHMP
jgi:hypothetical protein